jgi:RNA polymerase sigma factor (sigma-70 family)
MNEEQLYKQYEYLIPITVSKMFPDVHKFGQSVGLERDDIIQYGRYGLLDGIRTHDENITKSLRNHCIRCIRWSIGKHIPRERLNQSYYRFYQKDDDRNKKITLMSMSHKPFGDEDDTEYYDIISSDNINGMNESVEDKVISELETSEFYNILKPHEKEMVRMKMQGMIEKEIADQYGISRQAINIKFKQIRNKINKHRGVTV